MPLGYKGSYQRVRAYLHKKRTSPRPVTARPPSPRTVAGWILRRPETLTEPELRQRMFTTLSSVLMRPCLMFMRSGSTGSGALLLAGASGC